MAKLLLLNDTSEIRNWGTQVTMRALLKMLEEHLPGLKIATISQAALRRSYRAFRLPFGRRVYLDTHARISRWLPHLGRLIETRAEADDVLISPPNANALELSERRWLPARGHPLVCEFLDAVASADCVLHNGELLNYAWNDVGSRAMFIVWLAKTRYAKRAGVINQTTPPVGQDPVMSGLLQTIGSAVDLMTVREPHSQRSLQMLGVNCRMVPDPAFWLAQSEYDEAGLAEWRSQAGLSRPYFCLSMSSGLPVIGSAEVLTRLVRGLQRIAPTVVLLSYGGSNRLLRTVASRLDNCLIYAGGYRGVWPLLREASFLISGHYHNLILGAMVGCPFVPFAGLSHKVQGLLELLNWPHPGVFNPTALDPVIGDILGAADQVRNDRPNLSAHLLHRSGELRALSGETASLVASLLAAS